MFSKHKYVYYNGYAFSVHSFSPLFPPLLEFLTYTSHLPRIQPVHHLISLALHFLFLLRLFLPLNHHKLCSNKYSFTYVHRSQDQPLVYSSFLQSKVYQYQFRSARPSSHTDSKDKLENSVLASLQSRGKLTLYPTMLPLSFRRNHV